MNENTKNKFAELLKAANQKANIAPANLKANEPGFKPEVKDIFPDAATTPIPRPYFTNTELSNMNDNFIKSVVSTPELSDMTFADLLSGDNTAAKETIAPILDKPNLRIIDYSERSFAVIGDTKPIKDTLRMLGGSFNSRLTCGIGWIFSKRRLDAVKNELNLV